VQPGPQADDVSHVLADLLQRYQRDRQTNIGFPGATDFDYAELAPFLNVLFNNVGDPYVDGLGASHTKHLEMQVIEFFADLFELPPDDRWGYVASGGTEANIYALRLARELYPDAMVYHSTAAHDSIAKAADLLRMPSTPIRTDHSGEMDYHHLDQVLRHNSGHTPVIVATVGTTMTEAVDNIARITGILDTHHIREHFIHADAALAGIPFALDRDVRPDVRLSLRAVHSISISGHKFIGSPVPCAVVLTRDTLRRRLTKPGTYTASPDATITGSRSGLAPLLLWYRLHQIGWTDGLRKRAATSRQLAQYTLERLHHIGWQAWRNHNALTIVLKPPPQRVQERWTLPTYDGWSHLICVPGVNQDHIDRFVTTLQRVRRRIPVLSRPSAVGNAPAQRTRFVSRVRHT
jgi:histidine decarboxylase